MTFEQSVDSFQQSLNSPKVSVIIPIYNGEADLPDLLTCLKAQTYSAQQIEYLLVDNASRDRTLECLETATREFESLGLTLRPLSETQIQSSYAARNTGVRAAQGEILVFTDADCRPVADWLRLLVQPFQQPEIGVVVGEITALPGTTLLERYADLQDTLSQKHTLAHAFAPYGQTANLAVRRPVLEAVGLFRPYLTTGGDADLCWRIVRETTWQLHFAESAIVQHRHRATWKELASQWQRYGRSNRYLHELHGIDLMRELTLKEYGYRLARWLAKELPGTTVQLTTGKASSIDLLKTPIHLFCAWSRAKGQRQAVLPEAARKIDWLKEPL